MPSSTATISTRRTRNRGATAEIWQSRTFRLLYTNTVSVLQIPTLVAALGTDVRSFGVLLTATDTTAAQRLARREIGTALEEHLERSVIAAAKLNEASTACRIVTDDRAVREIAHEILWAAGWLADPGGRSHPSA
jgi:hypothetical protein